MFITTPAMFYVLRFILGLAEAGFFPGIILYLTYWYPSERRARMIALFMAAHPARRASVGGPLSGWIMQSFAGGNGWRGWQWLFLLEAIPAIVVGIAVAVLSGQRHPLGEMAERGREVAARGAHHAATAWPYPRTRRWPLCSADRRLWRHVRDLFLLRHGALRADVLDAVLIQSAGVRGTLHIGLFTAIPYSGAIVAMIVLGRERGQTSRAPLACGDSDAFGAAV